MTISRRSGTPAYLLRHLQRPWLWLGVAVLALVIAIGSIGGDYATRAYLETAAERGRNTVTLAVAALRAQMARYLELPELIAGQQSIKAVVANPESPAALVAANIYLMETNALLEATQIYVLMPDGTTVAASNFLGPTSFAGERFDDRPYFQDVISGREERFFALSSDTSDRGYYFGAPIRVNGTIEGALVFKVDAGTLEDGWRGADYEIIVADPEGTIFMSGRPEWLFTGIRPIRGERAGDDNTVYANTRLRDLPVSRAVTEDGRELLTISGNDETAEYLVVSQTLPEADWTLSVLLDTAPARAQALNTVIAALLVVGILALGVAVYLQRRASLRERMELQREARELLEHRVAERTVELAAVNRRLEGEVAERRATEDRLRETQADLIQAGKLAALGQMSAALSHEFNQPLAAARNYADNTHVLIERGRIADAAENVSRIAGLIDRMSAISRHLRNFARKPNQKLSAVPVAQVVADALDIMGWRVKQTGIAIETSLPETPLYARGGPVRLQQVLVNVLSNAIDAVSETDNKRVDIEVRGDGTTVTIAIRDHGPGIAEGLNERIFDPFFSTKGVGKGLGLGLSISYNIVKDFGGELRAANHAGGGAVFTVELVAAEAPARTEDALAEAAQ
ncbi:sensor histidine kinase [Pelagibacterium xiamenense]|uniref:sensor histidine kinase n=1 Tax=Pelagibacterium xiamenense TaxID=2901140 RepID=UPI001E55C698|nr:ATP-binding protein [Pelagibacterium xiamenense]MCD7059372.1 ATP-binding protein [Pelagibacterium xiamenense]